MSEEVTILMSVYNDDTYLKSSIDSVLAQTHTNFEFLIFEDCSTDNSSEILKEYSKKDDRIHVVYNKVNRGLSYNLHEGVKRANNSLIARMDADDICKENRIELQLKYIRENPEVDVLGSYVIDIDENNKELELRKVPTTHHRISKLIWTCPFIHPTVMYKKEAILKAGSYDKTLTRRQDYELWFRCKVVGLRFANLNEPLLYYRHTNDYFQKNDFKVQIRQLKMGLKGAVSARTTPVAYIGILIAFLKGILPYKIRKPVNTLFKKLDPRRTG